MTNTNTLAHRFAHVEAALMDWNKAISKTDRATKFERMAESAFVFYRGTNQLFWQDFAGDSRLQEFGNEKTRTWLQGDAHVENFGAFANSQGEIVYGLNDFDEAIVHDYQYDLWRMAISIVLVSRERNFKGKDQEAFVRRFSDAYLHTLKKYRGNKNEMAVIFARKTAKGRLKRFLKSVEKDNSRKNQVEDWTRKTDRGRRLDLRSKKLKKKLKAVSEDRDAEIRAAVPEYGKTMHGRRKYEVDELSVVDIAQRLNAGTGSLGTPRYYVLVKDISGGGEIHRILDVKRQSLPSGYPCLSVEAKALYDQVFEVEARRQAVAHHAMTPDADDFLGWVSLSDGSYSVRERSPFKETLPASELKTHTHFVNVAEQWAAVLATQHTFADRNIVTDLRSRLDLTLDTAQDMMVLVDKVALDHVFDEEVGLLTDGRHKIFRKLVCEIAFEYADQVESDWKAFGKCVAGVGVSGQRRFHAVQ